MSRDIGIWGLDAPEDLGGHDLPAVAMVAVNEALGRTIVPWTLPPDSPNLRMLAATVNDRQREAYLAPYVRRGDQRDRDQRAISADPAGMKTTASATGTTGSSTGARSGSPRRTSPISPSPWR
ncbi:acyl-CoA dehydrogenase family protein [Sphingomonas sp. MMS24-JH45]